MPAQINRVHWPVILYFMLLVSIQMVNAQSPKIDSILAKLELEEEPIKRGEILLQLVRLNMNDLPKYLEYLDQAAGIPTFASDPKWSMQLDYWRGFYYERLRKFDSARVYFQDVLEKQSPVISDTTTVSGIYFKLGNMSRLEGNLDKAIEYFQQSLRLEEARGDKSSIASSQVALGVIYKNLGLYDEALEYYNNAYETYEKLGNFENMATCILNIANVYSRQKKYDNAINYFNRALAMAEKVDNPDNLKGFIYGNLANCYTQQNQHARALEYSQKAYQLMKDKAGPEEQATMLIGISNGLRELGRLNESVQVLQDAQQLCENADGLIQVQERIQQQLFYIYLDKKQNDEARQAINRYIRLHDSLQRKEISQQLLDINTKYETEKKENEITLLNTENQLVAANLRAAKNRNIGLLIGFILVGGLLTMVYRLFQKTKLQNEQITIALNEKEVLLREIHHRVKNNLQVISSLLALQSEHVADSKALSALQEGQDRVQSMALIHQNLYQDDNLTGVSVKDYFVKLIRNLFDSYNIHNDRIELELAVEPLNLDVDTVVPIGLIVNELVSNSLKYAFPNERHGIIKVSLNEINNLLRLEIQDDGIGMKDNQQKSLGQSFGYRLIRLFTQQLKGNLTIEGEEGTRVRIDIKRYEKTSGV